MSKTAGRIIGESLRVWGLSWVHIGTRQLMAIAQRAAREQAEKKRWTMRGLIAAYMEESGPGCGNVWWNIGYALTTAGIDMTPKRAVQELVWDVMSEEEADY